MRAKHLERETSPKLRTRSELAFEDGAASKPHWPDATSARDRPTTKRLRVISFDQAAPSPRYAARTLGSFNNTSALSSMTMVPVSST